MGREVVADQPHPVADTVDIRPAADEDVPFIRATWVEGHRQSPGMQASPFWMFKQRRGALIERLLARPDTHLLAAYVPSSDPRWPERVAGWIAFTPGRVPALHWLYVRAGQNGYRERGLAGLLFEQSGIGRRLIHTFIGAQRPEKRVSVRTNDGTDRLICRKYAGAPYSEVLAEAGVKRGIASVYIPVEEFLSDE